VSGAEFDTLRAARRLKEAGATEPVAEAIAEMLGNSRSFGLAQLATKADLAVLRSELTVLRSDLTGLRIDLEAKIAAVELRLIKWMIGVGVAAFLAITGALSGVIWTATQILLRAHP
jgi:hypothetical protein